MSFGIQQSNSSAAARIRGGRSDDYVYAVASIDSCGSGDGGLSALAVCRGPDVLMRACYVAAIDDDGHSSSAAFGFL